ncbi:Outer membrane protein OmpA [Lutibacter oricola]|uniref:Outer membrane protein OmpA n=1 Tax=Lutibacter oricola TaxID=762486 RepID=A0A1H3C130_9FLAO|nr:OmpA family protein [Lutibacter oricola]SDX47796.1 Outer membrane protein OmpA [Lutibacter oricola]
MKKLLFSISLLMFGASAIAQDLPTNPEPGKCYVRCKTPDVWKNEDVTIETKAAYKKIVTRPAQYKTETERVLVQEASKTLKIVPAVYETRDVVVVVKEASYALEVVPGSFGSETVSYTAKQDASALKAIPATFSPDSQTIEIKPASAVWQMSDKAPDCQSDDPNDCRYWCYKPIPAQFVTVALTKLNVDAHTVKTNVPGFDKSYKKTVVAKEPTTRQITIPEVTKVVKKTVMVTPPTTKVVEIPAQYSTIKKVVLVKDAWAEEVTVPAQYKTVTKEVLVQKGGLTTWKEVDCAITQNSVLPINWNLGSATLTPEAKRIIDTRLLPVLKTGVAVAIESHTDSRGSKTSNQDLSERRALAVTNYLISKGINSSKLTGNGYGENRLTNRCSDGVSCTEREHRANRRTTFRVINQ